MSKELENVVPQVPASQVKTPSTHKQVDWLKLSGSVVMLALLLWIGWKSFQTATQAQKNWQEVQFAWEHPELVSLVRIKYALYQNTVTSTLTDELEGKTVSSTTSANPK